MGLEKHPVLVSVLVSKKLSGLGLGLGLEACGLDYNTGTGSRRKCYITGILYHPYKSPLTSDDAKDFLGMI